MACTTCNTYNHNIKGLNPIGQINNSTQYNFNYIYQLYVISYALYTSLFGYRVLMFNIPNTKLYIVIFVDV